MQTFMDPFSPFDRSELELCTFARHCDFHWIHRCRNFDEHTRGPPRKEEEAFECDCLQKQQQNRSMLYECRPTTGECSNWLLQRLRLFNDQGVKLEIFHTGTERGYGVRTLQQLQKDEVLIEYVGILYNKGDAPESDYLMQMEPDVIIDAREYGNTSRFINHCCEPNCQAQVWKVPEPRDFTRMQSAVAIVAVRDIPPGTELTFDYALDRQKEPAGRRRKCLCGAPNCRRML